MENLFGTIGKWEPDYLLATNVNTEAITISVEPGHGEVKRGTVMYRKEGSVMFAPAAAENVTAANYLVVLRDDVNSDASETVAMAAAAYRKANLIAGSVLLSDGSAVAAAQEVALRMQGLALSQMLDRNAEPTVADNGVTE